MLKMPGQNGDVIECQTVLRNHTESIDYVIADDPIRVRFDVHQVTHTYKSAFRCESTQNYFDALRLLKRHPAHNASDPRMISQVLKEGLVFCFAVYCLHQDGGTYTGFSKMRDQIAGPE
jgi:hypothetical protein